MKWDKDVNYIAEDIMAFVDDLWASGLAEEQAWQIARHVALQLQYLGIQDAPKKRRPPIQNPRLWLEPLDKITQLVSQPKWGKGKRQVDSLCNQLSQDPKS
jgi:hypothetical protein